MSSCLVMLNMQTGFLDVEYMRLINKISDLLSKYTFDHVVATNFEDNKESSFSKYLGDSIQTNPEKLILPRLRQYLEKVFVNNTYTCFTEEFKEYIKDHEISKLYFIGMDTDLHIFKSVLDSFEMQIDYEVLTNYCASRKGRDAHFIGIQALKDSVGEKYINEEW